MRRILALLAIPTLVLALTATPVQATHLIDFGAYVQPQNGEGQIEAFQRFESVGGNLSVTRHYLTNWTDATPGGLLLWSAQQGQHPFVSLHTRTDLTGITWAEVAAGDQDAFLTDFANGLQSLGVQVWFAFHHEPENDTDAGTAADFQAAATHVYDLMKPICTNCQIGVDFMRGTFTGAHGGIDAWLPDAAHMDFVGADLYANYGSTTPLSTLAGPALAKARSLGKPLLIGEAGISGTAAQKAAWLKAARTFLKATPDIVLFDYSETVAAGGDFRVETSSKALTAWKAITSDPYFQ